MIDTHLHLFDPALHPFNDVTVYEPQSHECSTLAALRRILAFYGVNKAFLVAPTVGYNHNLAPLTDTLEAADLLLTGVARLRGNERMETLAALSSAGVQGVRVDLRHDGAGHAARLTEGGAPQKWARFGWFVQVQADAAIWSDVGATIAQWPLPVVIDHCGLPDVSAGLDQPGFQMVCQLSQRPKTWAKLSGAFRFSKVTWPFEDTDIYARRLLELYGADRCLWGSDWPFVRIQARLDYGAVLRHLSRWVPDALERKTILEDSPISLLDRSKV